MNLQSDTPRTDEALLLDQRNYTGNNTVNTSRQLERELNAAKERIKQLEAVVNDPDALWANWLRGNVRLPVGIGDVRQHQDRINRLEKAGDNLDSSIACGCGVDGPCMMCMRALDAWKQAKEVNP